MAVLSSSNSQIDVTSFLNNSTQTVIAVHNDIISIYGFHLDNNNNNKKHFKFTNKNLNELNDLSKFCHSEFNKYCGF